MEETKISVIVPLYNTEAWLPRCIETICNQTYRNLEIIIVNDGSTDGSGKVADELAKRDNRIRVFHKENNGTSSARNFGIEKATGEYIGFIDSDDFIEPEMYERLMEYIKKEDLLIAQASRDELDIDGNKLDELCVPSDKEEIWESYVFMRELLLHRGDASFCTKLTKASLLEEDKFPQGLLNEDFHLLIRLLLRVERIGLLPERYYHVFHRIGSTTRKEKKEEFSRVFIDIVNNADMIERIVERECPVLKKESIHFALYQRMDYLLHIPISQMTRGNEFYKNVVKYIRSHVLDIIGTPYLSGKYKRYLLLFAIAPKTVRKVHASLKKK